MFFCFNLNIGFHNFPWDYEIIIRTQNVRCFIIKEVYPNSLSESWRERLRRRRLEIGIEGEEYDYIQRYIESYCSEADRLCKKINMHKTVDEVIDSMKDKKFDEFTRGVISSIHKKRGYDPHDDSKGESLSLVS